MLNFQLAERFNIDGVTAITYVHGNETGENEINYEDLSEGTLEEILELAKNFKRDEEDK